MSRFHLPHSKKQESHKFEVGVTVKSMVDLPSKYKLLRLELTRGAKADSTKEMVVQNNRADPNPSDGTMKTLCTMYTAPGQSGIFEEKTYKLTLMRINQRSMLHKAKKIGTSYLNLAEYVSLDGTSQDLKITMKCAESTKPAVLTLNIRSTWLKNYKGSDDAMSDISGMNIETASQATSQASLNSIDEDDEDEFPPDGEDDGAGVSSASAVDKPVDDKPATPQVKRVSSAASVLSPTAQAASGGDVKELHDSLVKAQTELKYTTANLKDIEKQLELRETELDSTSKECARLEGELEKAMRVQEELMQENDKAEHQYTQLLAQFNSGSAKAAGEEEKVEVLQGEVRRAKAEAASLREERDQLRNELEKVSREKAEVEEQLAAAKASKDGEGGAALEDLQAELESEKARSAKFKGWFEKMREQKGALESEAEELRAQLESNGPATANSKPVPPEPVTEDKGPSGADGEADTVPRGELEFMKEEVERISMQLVTASLGHAQAEQDRLEAKQQVYKLKDVNRKLREKLTELELQLAKSSSS